MPLIELPAKVVEENIRDNRRRLELQEVQDNNKRLKTKETGYEDRVETAKADLKQHNIWLAKVTQDLEKVRTSVSTAKQEKQASTQAVTNHEHALTTFRQTMQSSNVDMAD